jgi:hypothetical protein
LKRIHRVGVTLAALSLLAAACPIAAQPYPTEFAEFLKSEVAKWAKVIKHAGITAE